MPSAEMPRDGLTPEEVETFRQFASQGVLPTIETSVRESTAAFYWYEPRPGGRGTILGGGTMCFVRTPERLLGITNEHIHRIAVETVEAHPHLGCQVGGHSFDPVGRLIDADETLDVATYDISDVQLPAIGAFAHNPTEWPVPPPSVGSLLYLGGWPWRMVEEQVGESHHSFLSFIGRANIVSAVRVGMATFTSRSMPWASRSLPPGTNLGGMSGGPVYALDLDSFVPTRLVGFIFEYSPGFEQILAVPIDRITAGGEIMRHETAV